MRVSNRAHALAHARAVALAERYRQMTGTHLGVDDFLHLVEDEMTRRIIPNRADRRRHRRMKGR